MVRTGAAVGIEGENRCFVLDPMTMAAADTANETGVPLIVMAGLPGTSVWLPTTYCEALFGVTGLWLSISTGAVLDVDVITVG